MKAEKFYKVLSADGAACNGGNGKWFLPEGNRPGKWMPPVEGIIEACLNGYHLVKRDSLINWLHESIYEAEGRGDCDIDSDKTAFREARLITRLNWDERIARHFACDCAQRVMKIWKKQYPNDNRPQEAIRIARLFADGKATSEELAAAKNAAGAARNAARAAWATWAARAAWAVGDAGAAAKTAENAARDAWVARATAWVARDARDAAWAAEKKWQTKRLFEYLEGKRG